MCNGHPVVLVVVSKTGGQGQWNNSSDGTAALTIIVAARADDGLSGCRECEDDESVQKSLKYVSGLSLELTLLFF